MSLDLFHQLLEAQRLSQEDLLRRRGVVGVAIGFRNYKEQVTDQLAMAVLVEQKKPIEALSAEDLVPPDVNGARTDVIEIGRLEAQLNPRDRFRPNIPAGVSIGHYKVTAGTLGAVVFDNQTGEPLLLSNNHVLANSNQAAIGDAILQPGTTDHGVRPMMWWRSCIATRCCIFTTKTVRFLSSRPARPRRSSRLVAAISSRCS